MKLVPRLGSFPLFAFLSGLLVLAGTVRADLPRADLSGEVEQVMNDHLLDRAAVGIDVVRLEKSASDVATIYRG